MEERLNQAPFGYLVMDLEGKVVEMNLEMKRIWGRGEMPEHIHEMLTTASRVYFQTYFLPAVTLHKRVTEMSLMIKSERGPIPVLMNSIERNGFFECAMIEMTIRGEYEKELLLAKKQAEKINQESAEANARLQKLLAEVEAKQLELEKLNGGLKQQADTDALTGLKNRRYLEKEMDNLLGRAKEGLPLTTLIIDIDYFKKVNDTYGHHTGDLVLQELAGKLKEEAEAFGIVARLGGEEFFIVLPGFEQDQALNLAEQIRRRVEMDEWAHTPITVSIGMASFSEKDDEVTLYTRADEALYASKKGGRNRVTAL
ncbi:Response regulator PleD [Planococcus massiliensis]|uniref:Response regulator PleD n=1 Tax=Planococcus massiliensis TaxID=1499687 RepID=A0A098EH17_9BACL|nr:GGDEF domain-containing protein [Planococcus massiliensis]CEG21563.1 Response regulator PleD [Planococcus massiliensis]